MKSLSNFLIEEDDDIQGKDPRKALIQYITSNFYRFVQHPDIKDQRGMLLLIAAISLLNSGDETYTINAAKRLAQLALSQSGKALAQKRKSDD